jgi:serine/threonine protein kinase
MSAPGVVNPKYLAPGTVIGGCYRVVDQVGSGGLAAVYKVEDRGKFFALKMATYSAADLAPEEREHLDERAKREFIAIGNLRHPNIINVHFFGRYPDSDGYPFLVMDFVDGLPLYDWQATFTPSLQDLARLFMDLGDTLDYMHDHKVAHRDLKSGNLLVVGGAEDAKLKVIDFNIANPASAYTLTIAGGMLGTPSHLTPEQCEHFFHHADHPTERFEGGPLQDLHCVGFIFYEMLAGRAPWDLPDDEITLMRTIRKIPPRPLAAVVPDVPTALCDVVMRLLRRDPAERFQSGAELRDAIGPILDQLSTSPYPCRFPPRPRHSSSLSTPPAGSPGTTPTPAAASSSSGTKVERPVPRARGPLLAASLAVVAAAAGMGGGLWWATTRAQASTASTPVPVQPSEATAPRPTLVGAERERSAPTAATATPKLVLPETVLPAAAPAAVAPAAEEARPNPIVPAPSAAPIALAPRKAPGTSAKLPAASREWREPTSAPPAAAAQSNGVLVQSIRTTDSPGAPDRGPERLLGAPKGMRFSTQLTADVDAAVGQRVEVSLQRPLYYGTTFIFPSRTRLSGAVSAVDGARVTVHLRSAVLPDGRAMALDASAVPAGLQAGASCEVVLASAL